MAADVQFTEDELALLHLLVVQDTEKNRVELCHTSGIPYREYITQRLEQGRALLKKMDDTLPIRAVANTL